MFVVSPGLGLAALQAHRSATDSLPACIVFVDSMLCRLSRRHRPYLCDARARFQCGRFSPDGKMKDYASQYMP